jgi:hypothetical protein
MNEIFEGGLGGKRFLSGLPKEVVVALFRLLEATFVCDMHVQSFIYDFVVVKSLNLLGGFLLIELSSLNWSRSLVLSPLAIPMKTGLVRSTFISIIPNLLVMILSNIQFTVHQWNGDTKFRPTFRHEAGLGNCQVAVSNSCILLWTLSETV